MNCPDCKKIIRVTEEEKLNNGLMRYKCELCKTWSKDNKKKIALWWIAIVFLFLSFGAQHAELGLGNWPQALCIAISIALLILSHKQKQLITASDNL